MYGHMCILYVDETDMVSTWIHLDMYTVTYTLCVTDMLLLRHHFEGVLWL